MSNDKYKKGREEGERERERKKWARSKVAASKKEVEEEIKAIVGSCLHLHLLLLLPCQASHLNCVRWWKAKIFYLSNNRLHLLLQFFPLFFILGDPIFSSQHCSWEDHRHRGINFLTVFRKDYCSVWWNTNEDKLSYWSKTKLYFWSICALLAH